MKDKLTALLKLCHEIGREDRQSAILGEGNVSAKLDATQFAVKASGSSLGTLSEADITICDTALILAMLDKKQLNDEGIEKQLLDGRSSAKYKKPSTEAIFHAWLLTLEGVEFVGHCHPTSANQILCSPRARDYAEKRLFPDEIVCCGPSSVFVPYSDPGLVLAREIRDRTTVYMQQQQRVPRLIVLQNHGIIALGSTANAVLACILMASKAAAIFVGASALGGPNFMAAQHVERINGRPDELYRQRQLKI